MVGRRTGPGSTSTHRDVLLAPRGGIASEAQQEAVGGVRSSDAVLC